MFKLYVESDDSGKFNAFLDILHYYCDIPIPIKVIYGRNHSKNLITQGSKNASKRICFLVNQR